MTAFLAKQREFLGLLASPAVPGESVKAVVARIAHRASITRSKAEKAWRGYAVLRGDEWERVVQRVAEQSAAGQAARGANNEMERIRELEASLVAVRRQIDDALRRLGAGQPVAARGAGARDPRGS